jgi:hypothetical protein
MNGLDCFIFLPERDDLNSGSVSVVGIVWMFASVWWFTLVLWYCEGCGRRVCAVVISPCAIAPRECRCQEAESLLESSSNSNKPDTGDFFDFFWIFFTEFGDE